MGTCSAPNALLRNSSSGPGSHFHEAPILIVTRNLADAEERAAVGAGGLLVHAALEVEEGGELEEERGEGAGSGIGDVVALVGAGTWVGHGGGGLVEAVQKGLERSGIGNGWHILCLKAVPTKLSPQKLVPCCRPLSGCRDKKVKLSIRARNPPRVC